MRSQNGACRERLARLRYSTGDKVGAEELVRQMFTITLIIIGVVLFGLFFMFGGHHSRLQGASKEIKLATDVAPEPLGECLDRAERSSSPTKGNQSLA